MNSLKTAVTVMLLCLCSTARPEDGSRLWLRGEMPADIILRIDSTMPDDDGYRISGRTVTARTERGLLYGRYALLRGEQGESHPFYRLRILNHWDNLDGSIERGYAGASIFWEKSSVDTQLIRRYGEACASVGINGTVLNNVNASPKMLTRKYIKKVKDIADILRPWGIRVYLSVNFGSPKALGELRTADPLDPQVRLWWQKKAEEIYAAIPDFGGFLVKANSEGQPGPFDYGRTHADGANMLADALKPYGGIVMWRSFVYGAKHQGEDRVKQAVSEFAELDGQFRDNVILQSKNGPLDFQPREPYAPVFDHMNRTAQMAELQITQEYLGQSRHLVYLAPMWKEFFSFVSPGRLVGIAGVANIGLDTNWCGHHFSQANWYAFGRLAWNPELSSEQIAKEWLTQTFGNDSNSQLSIINSQLLDVMLRSREACVDYMMPLGLHHIFKFDHHMGPDPGGYKASYPIECQQGQHRRGPQQHGYGCHPAVSRALPLTLRQHRDLPREVSPVVPPRALDAPSQQRAHRVGGTAVSLQPRCRGGGLFRRRLAAGKALHRRPALAGGGGAPGVPAKGCPSVARRVPRLFQPLRHPGIGLITYVTLDVVDFM